jgi:diacylglycerol kinase family enzyme
MPPLESLSRLGDAFASLDAPAERKRMLVIVNPYATTVSDRLRTLVTYALQSRYDVRAVDTTERGHATNLAREAARDGYDVVVAFGGDGTLNEAANGLAHSGTPLTMLPGGATNVYCRLLGIPVDVVDATEHLLRLADAWTPRQVDLGKVNDRIFTFSAGYGLDASVVAKVDAHPRLKSRYGPWYFAYAATTTFFAQYARHPPQLEVTLPSGETIDGVTALVQNADPYTYFRTTPIHLAEDIAIDSGDLAGIVLRRSSAQIMPSVSYRLLSPRAKVADHRAIAPFAHVDGLVARSTDGRPVALEVDGDHIGDVTEARFEALPGALTVVA